MREGSVQFKVTRFVGEGRHCSGQIVIRKGGRAVVSCYVLPSEDKSRVSYVFAVSPDYISESDFFLWEGRWGELTIVARTNTKTTTKVREVDVRFPFPLRDFAKSVGDSQ